MTSDYPFADLELARRLERTEGRGNVEFVEARARAFPDRDATWTEVAGAYAMFDGIGSPWRLSTSDANRYGHARRIFSIERRGCFSRS